ncbi:MAG: PilW family protein [Candidatus Contendobacter sp.]|nr:PilW family protein [Candidatus Contendobacter sp.]
MNSIRQSLSRSAQRQHGLSLVEILVALVLSLFLLVGVIQLFIGSKQTYRFHDALSRVQENGRFALEAMARDIRMAGYQPVGGTATITPIAGTGNDQITVAWSNDGVNLVTRAYSVGTGASGKSALFLQRQGDASPQELVEGVEQMQISYGEDTTMPDADGVADEYKLAGNVVDWTRVVSVRVDLLLASVQENTIPEYEPNTIIFPYAGSLNSNTVTVPNRRLPLIFSTTVGIRNRIH